MEGGKKWKQREQSAEILKQCSTMLKKVMSHKYAWVFNEPVDATKQGLYDYHKVI
jgi:bromodomain testis-specific protein